MFDSSEHIMGTVSTTIETVKLLYYNQYYSFNTFSAFGETSLLHAINSRM